MCEERGEGQTAPKCVVGMLLGVSAVMVVEASSVVTVVVAVMCVEGSTVAMFVA